MNKKIKYVNNFFYIYCLLIKNVIKNKNIWFPKKHYKIFFVRARAEILVGHRSGKMWPR